MTSINEEVAGMIAAAGVGIAAIWKFVLWGRRDVRADRVESDITRGHSTIITALRSEVDRLAAQVRQLETENAELRQRVRELEWRLDDGR